MMMISVYYENRQRLAGTKIDIYDEGERIAMEVVRQVSDLSEECLRDPELAE
jgi:hypothetical protein